jgi:hypothetical protein
MKKVILSTLFLVIALISFSQVYVNGYYRSNGTYVKPHYRSNPDGIKQNNWSYKGNVNPYTGKVGTKTADYTSGSSSSFSSGSSSYYGTSYVFNKSLLDRDITDIPTYSNSYSRTSTSKINYLKSSKVTVKAKVLNVRSSPIASSSGNIIDKLFAGQTVTVQETSYGDWIKIRVLVYNSFKKEFEIAYGYISAKYVF